MSDTILERIRWVGLAAGSVSLILAMLVYPEQPWPRDLVWSIGVAALVFTLLVNRLLGRREPDSD